MNSRKKEKNTTGILELRKSKQLSLIMFYISQEKKFSKQKDPITCEHSSCLKEMQSNFLVFIA